VDMVKMLQARKAAQAAKAARKSAQGIGMKPVVVAAGTRLHKLF